MSPEFHSPFLNAKLVAAATAVALVLLPEASAITSASSSSLSTARVPCDPHYEQRNATTGQCDCREGFSGFGCRMCTSSGTLASTSVSDVCSATFGYDAHATLKTYGCTLSTDLQALFPDGALDVRCDRDAQGVANCSAAVFKAKETVHSAHVIDCNITQCAFATGDANGECAQIDCKCGPQCSAMTKALVRPFRCLLRAQLRRVNAMEVEEAARQEVEALAAILENQWALGCYCGVCSSGGDVAALWMPLLMEDVETEILKFTSRSVNTLDFGTSAATWTAMLSLRRRFRQNDPAECPCGGGKSTIGVAGELLLDGKPLSKEYRRIAAYVQQDDSLYSTLTVRECISYSAQLRLPPTLSDSVKNAMVDRVIAELNLTHIANSRIGSRRRVSIGMELVTSPRILILDEPTSGLDSSSAHSVVQLMKDLADHGRIVVLSIHQPSARSFLLLDKIMLLGKGKLLYSGEPAESKSYFQELGFKCPETETDEIFDDTKTPARSMLVEIRVLFARTAQNILRHRSLLVLHIALSLSLALFGGLIFNHVTNDLAGFQNRMGAFYFILTFFGFASMSSMDLFIGERQIFLRETGAMYYGAFSYFLAKATLDTLLLRILPASLFASIFYWIMGLQATTDRFLLFSLTLVLFNVAAGAICLLVGVLSRRVGAANLGATVILLVMLLFGGFLLNSQTMPSSVGWLKHLSIFSYAFEILMTNELKGLILKFDAPGYPAVPVYGEVYLKTLGMDYANRFYDVAALALIAVSLQVLAFLFLSLQVPLHRSMADLDEGDGVAPSGKKKCRWGEFDNELMTGILVNAMLH
ncbi:P-loop containing nucleoside triphosphate hydrolase [Phytophthora cactorum]|nr:P-loop containing nucleoside triphosphate hydrolase [Phytophthora cactorum]